MKKKLVSCLVMLFFTLISFNAKAQDAMLAEVKLFAGNFAPRGWAFCQGQLLAISQNTALFSILGTTYGGDGRTTFALPDLRGRVPVGVGNGPGLSDQKLGEKSGTETTTIQSNQLPSHSHNVPTVKVGIADNSSSQKVTVVSETTDGAKGVPTYNTGGGQAINNKQPSLGLNYIICMQGFYPSRS